MEEPTVLHCVPTWLPLTQTWLHGQVAELQRQGLDTHVGCEGSENLDQFPVANIHCLNDEPRWRQRWDRGVRKFHFRRYLHHLVRVGHLTGAHIVHSHFGNVGWENLGAVRRLGAKHVVTFYGLDVNYLPTKFTQWRKRYQQLFKVADLFLCEGSHMARCLVDLGCPENKIQVLHLGIEIEKFKFHPRQWLPDEPLKFLIAASFREKKGIPTAIEALVKISKFYPIELTIIGDSGPSIESQQEKEKINNILNSSGLIKITRNIGYQTHSAMIQEAYAHHIFLHPSLTAKDGDTEGGAPVGIIEMMATGMPVVSTTHCDIPGVLGPSLSHLLAPPDNAGALAQIIKNLIEEPESWLAISKISRERVIQEFDLKKQTSQLIDFYQSL